jgi:hypothetical protein
MLLTMGNGVATITIRFDRVTSRRTQPTPESAQLPLSLLSVMGALYVSAA